MRVRAGIDILLNKESSRETPTVVTFNAKQRQTGTDAVGALATNPRNTVTQLKRLLGRSFADEVITRDAGSWPFKVVAGEGGAAAVEVNYLGEPTVVAPETLLGAMLVDLKGVAEREQGAALVDVVLTVPAYFGERERAAVLAAAHAAGLTVLQLLNDVTAEALSYGIYRTDLPEEGEPELVVGFCDVGHSGTQAAVVAFRKGQLRVLGAAADASVGGRDLDEALFAHFADQFDAKHGLSIRSSPRAAFRLRTACEKAKKVLTTNPEATFAVECLQNDVDVQGKITRDEFEALDGVKRVLAGIERVAKLAVDRAAAAFAAAKPKDGEADETKEGGEPKDAPASALPLRTLELLGGASRTPAVARAIAEAFAVEAPSRTLNAKEAASRGAALAAAMLSPAFRVRDFKVADALAQGIDLEWDKDGRTVVTPVFPVGALVPSAKLLSFFRAEPFEIRARYASADGLAGGEADRDIAAWKVGPFAVPPSADVAKLKVKVVLDANSLLSLESAVAIHEEEEEEEEEANQANDAATEAKDAAAEAKDAAAPAKDAAAPAAAAPAPRKRRTRKVPVPTEQSLSLAYASPRLASLHETECAHALTSRVQEETNDAKNAVEAYIYSLRARLSDALAPFATEREAESIPAALTAAEDWLYEDGEDETKAVYAAKLAELRALGDPIERRHREAQEAPAAAAALRAAAQTRLERAEGPAKPAHVDAALLAKVADEARAALAWLGEKEKLQAAAQRGAEPVLLAHEIEKKKDTLERFADPILNTPKPAEPEPAPAADAPDAMAEDAKAEDAKADEAMETDA